jgi:hypothetical protein
MTSNLELLEMASKLKIPNFKGVICRDEFDSLLPHLDYETGIYNFNDSSKSGSHWASYCKRKDNWYHFCSYGSDPCEELKMYSRKPIMSHTYRLQNWDETNCGEWCVLFCYLMSLHNADANADAGANADAQMNPKLKYEDVVLFFYDTLEEVQEVE